MTMLAPGSVIGILGGGQLGRMLSIAAAQLGFSTLIYNDEADCPAGEVSARVIAADYGDRAALTAFARETHVVTTEFENVPAATAQALIEAGAIVRPNPGALAIAQDRFLEKQYFNAHGVGTAPFAAIDAEADIAAAIAATGLPAILKTRRMGYDGKGQARAVTIDDVRAGLAALGGGPCILEGLCAFEREVSLIAARGENGAIAFYDPIENEHRGGILHRSRAPARLSADAAQSMRAAMERVLIALDYVGVLTIEFFLMPDGSARANEMAPRVHNSGHWTIEGALTSQFEQHIRAIAGWPLGATDAIASAEMINLIGEDVAQWRTWASDPAAHLHLYGKRDARPGRKMGHVTRLLR